MEMVVLSSGLIVFGIGVFAWIAFSHFIYPKKRLDNFKNILRDFSKELFIEDELKLPFRFDSIPFFGKIDDNKSIFLATYTHYKKQFQFHYLGFELQETNSIGHELIVPLYFGEIFKNHGFNGIKVDYLSSAPIQDTFRHDLLCGVVKTPSKTYILYRLNRVGMGDFENIINHLKGNGFLLNQGSHHRLEQVS